MDQSQLIFFSKHSPSSLIRKELKDLLNEECIYFFVCAFIERAANDLRPGELVAITANNLGGKIYVIGQVVSTSQLDKDNTEIILSKNLRKSFGVIALSNSPSCSITPAVAQMIEQSTVNHQ